MLRRVELWDANLVIPPALAARAAVLAFGDELVDLRLPRDDDDDDDDDDAGSRWLSQGGRDMAAAVLLPRAKAALRQQLQQLAADAAKRASERASERLARAMTMTARGFASQVVG